MSLEENKVIVRKFFEKANSEGRTPVEMCTPGFTAHIGTSPPMDLHGFQQYQKSYFASFSNTVLAIEDMLAEGDKVAFRGVVQAIHSGDYMGIPASGKKIVVPVIGIAQLVDGKIREWWNFPDRLSWMQQIGAIPSK
jgi:predicted ester cyclase